MQSLTRADQWTSYLNLKPHPEGGHYRQNYKSIGTIAKNCLPSHFNGDRAFSTAIYFLLKGNEFSAFHRIRQDELWHFYDGASLILHIISPMGEYTTIKVGTNIRRNESPQAVIKAGNLFAATVEVPESFSLLGCTVAPGFEFDDFEMPDRTRLIRTYPEHRNVISQLTR